MFAMDDAKFPPPKPAVAAMATSTPNEVSGRFTTHANPTVGISSNSAEMTVQLRPPKIGTAKVYGTRNKAPTPEATARSVSPSPAVSAQPLAPVATKTPASLYVPYILTTTMDHSSHTENPTCSAAIEKTRLRSATALPLTSQNWGSSGVHRSIHRPGPICPGSTVAVGAVSRTLMRALPEFRCWM